MTYKDLINKINDGDYGVSAYTLGTKIFMSSKKEGTEGEIKFDGNTSTLFQDMGLAKADGTALNLINKAQNAIYSINGIEGKSSTNTIEALPGVKIELLKVTEQTVEEKPEGTTDVDPKTTDAKAKGIDLKFTVSDSNVTDASNVIKKMVADYNKAVNTVDLLLVKVELFKVKPLCKVCVKR